MKGVVYKFRTPDRDIGMEGKMTPRLSGNVAKHGSIGEEECSRRAGDSEHAANISRL